MTRIGRFECFGDGAPVEPTGMPVGSLYFDRSNGGQRYQKLSVSTWSPTGPTIGNALLTAYAAGTVATVADTTSAALSFGTTSPTLTISAAGTYLLSASFQLEAAGATVTTQTTTFKLRRSNNTAADVTGATVTIDLPAMTTLTHTLGVFSLPPKTYTTTNTDDVVSIFAANSAGMGAGSLTVSAACILAQRLY